MWPGSGGGAVHTPSALSDLGGQVPEDGGGPGVVREKVPGPDGDSEPVTAVYLVPFRRADLSLPAQLLRLLRTDEAGCRASEP
ncbi:hypothetical protein [Streptomyces sp. NPDC092370]|uniref:hypothetical protein n=1 Tax=Streptomyces sp. NPDC092370 TaxID=3366016 RepID=UPI00381A0EB0